MNDQMRAALHEFLAESMEGLDRVDVDLVELEHDPGSTDALASVFRIVHTIKGSGGILGFGRLEGLAHDAENLLSLVRFGRLRVDRPIIDALLATVDVVRAAMLVIEASGHEPADDHRDLRARLTRLQDPDRRDLPTAEGPAAAVTGDAPVPGPKRQSHRQSHRQVRRESHRQSHRQSNNDDPLRAHIDPDVHPDGHPDARPDVRPDVDQRMKPASADGPVRSRRRIGEILQANGVVDDAGLMLALTERTFGDSRPLGQILHSLGIVTAAQLTAALREQQVTEERRQADNDATVRVDVAVLDELMDLVGELVLARNQLMQLAQARQDAEFMAPAQRLHLITSELQQDIMQTRLQPIGLVLHRLPQMVHELSAACAKDVRLVLEGTGTELDRTVVEALSGPITHLVRNAVDHGIEPPDVRLGQGKEAHGTLFIRAFHESGKVNIDIIDDGRGLDVERIRARAVANELLTEDEAAQLSDREALDVIFTPGFSTAESVTNISGRGVGMDVVKTNIERIGGSVELASTVGTGTTIRIRIPLTMAIIPALVVLSAGQRYVIPQVNLVELARLDPEELRRHVELIHGCPVLRLRGRLLPLVGLVDVLAGGSGTDLAGALAVGNRRPVNIVVVQADEHAFGVVVDGVFDTQEIVVKPLARQLRDAQVFAGATIMSDGKLALILDVVGLARRAGVVVERVSRPVARWGTAIDADAVQQQHSSLVIVRTGEEQSAVPLAEVARLEQIPASSVERSNGHPVVQYRGDVLRLVGLGDVLGQYSDAAPSEVLRVLIHRVGAGQVGLVVESIVDITEAVVDRRDRRGFVSGTTVVGDRVTDVIDTRALLEDLLGVAGFPEVDQADVDRRRHPDPPDDPEGAADLPEGVIGS